MIKNGNAVAIEYTLTLQNGSTVDSNVGKEPLTYTQGNQEILPALEQALLGEEVGSTKLVQLTAEQGYGTIDLEAFEEVAIDQVPEDARTVGTMLVATDPEGNQQPIKIHEVRQETVILDFNHPLAGEALTFDVKVLTVD